MTEGVIKQFELSRSWDILYDIISTDVTDPLTGDEARSSPADWIKNTFPNPLLFGKPVSDDGWKFPIIIINVPDLEYEAKVLDESAGLSRISFEIDVHGRTPYQVELLAERIRYQLEQNRPDLRTGTLQGMKLSRTNNNIDFIGSTKFHSKKLIFEFQRFD
jgi:hypothetical protein